MTFSRLLRRNLFYHWRGNLAVFLGVVVGTAVLTGALFVGDSLRGSLRELALDRLGWVEQALVAPRFFRAGLAGELPAEKTAPAILLQGSVLSTSAKDARPVPRVNVLGVDSRFWTTDELPVGKDFWQSNQAEVVLNATLADVLRVKVGDPLQIQVQKAEDIPRESLLGKRKTEDVIAGLPVVVKAILPDQGLGGFTLKPSPEPARNLFVPLGFLQESLELKDQANALLLRQAKKDVEKTLQAKLQLADWNLKLTDPADRARNLMRILDPRSKREGLIRSKWFERIPEELAKQADADGFLPLKEIEAYFRAQRGYVQLESRQLLLEPSIVNAALALRAPAGGGEIKTEKVLIYLADSVAVGKKEWPYVVIAGKESLAEDSPGPGEIDLADWPGDLLKAKPGDEVDVSYYAADDHNHLQLLKETFKVRKRFPLTGAFDDPDLTPEFPGITDKVSMASWENPPFPYNPRRVKKEDEDFWKRYRTTPRAYVNMKTAQKLWGSRLGNVTSLRFFPEDPETWKKTFAQELLSRLNPEAGGFMVQNVREQALQAGGGATDFGVLFLAFSFFLIAAALLLVGLLFRLSLDRRGPEMGLLAATGWAMGRVRRLLLGEGLILAILGSGLGVLAARFYAEYLLDYLSKNWPGEERLNFLHLHATATSMAIGFASSVVVSFLTIVWATRLLKKVSPRYLLAGQTEDAGAQADRGPGKISAGLIGISLVAGLACWVAGFFVQGHEAKAGSFFGSGALLLIAVVALLYRWLKKTGRVSRPQPTLAGLGIRNAGRHVGRSLATTALLASATFLITAVEAFHKETGQGFADRQGGSGGFPLLAESDVPIFQDLNQTEVRKNLPFPENDLALVEKTRVYSFRLRAGDDASCLNLYQPLQPRILGVPGMLLKEDRFHFAGTLEKTEKPWELLDRSRTDGKIPVFADANSAQWILKVSLGGTLKITDGAGESVELIVVGLLAESIFQSEVLMSADNFKKLFPRQEGFNFFLIDAPWERAQEIKSAWEQALADQGFSADLTRRRLERYQAVENTYLATFKALGGLGLLLGAVGLGIVLLRGVWERRGELALLRALGFRKSSLAWLVMVENLLLLVVGLAAGTLCALAAVMPHLLNQASPGWWWQLGEMLGLVLLVGIVTALLAVVSALRAPLMVALRRE